MFASPSAGSHADFRLANDTAELIIIPVNQCDEIRVADREWIQSSDRELAPHFGGLRCRTGRRSLSAFGLANATSIDQTHLYKT
jgi:hypothetical protein